MLDDPKPEHTRFATILGGVLAVGCLLCLLLAWSVLEARRTAWADAATTSINLATTLGREVARAVETYDLSLRATVRASNAPALRLLDPLSRHQATFDGVMGGASFGPTMVMDADGAITAESDGIVPRDGSGADREYFLVHKYRTVEGLFVSRPFESRIAQAQVVALSRRITAADGGFGGVAVGLLHGDAFAALVAKLDLAPGAVISLLNDDGILLYHSGAGGVGLRPEVDSASLVRRLHGGEASPIDAPSLFTGEAVLSAVVRIHDLPLLLVVETPLAAVYAGWTTKTVLTGLLSVLLLATGALLLRALRRQQLSLLRAERRAVDLSERGRTEAERMHASKMEAVGRLTAGIAHDFNNYLQTITSSLEIISADYLVEPEAKDVAQIAHKAASNGAKLTHRLLTFSQQQVLQPRRVSAAFLLGDIRKLVTDARVFDVHVTWKVEVEPFTDDLHVDVTQMESCLVNLLLNARDAMPHGGIIQLGGRNAGPEEKLFGSLTPGRHVVLTVRDNGHGMDQPTRIQAFEPFFTTKPFGKGAGLGLSMAQGFCHQSGGDIRILDMSGEFGTTIELWLPAAPTDALSEDEAEVNFATIGRGTGRVLLVEDEHDVLLALSAILVRGGFEVVSVNNAADGLMRLHDRTPYDAVVTDHAMPDMTGAAFAARVAAEMPDLPILILTGGDIGDAAALPRSVRRLRKPIRRMGLLNAVREAIGENSKLLVN